jgi:predicted phosphate transport protein (TIGR00153 family)
MVKIPFIHKDDRFYTLLHDGAANLVEAADNLTDLVNHFENVAMKTERISDLEHQGDTITHQIMNLLHKTFVTPIEPEDITLLAQRMDDVMDLIEGAATYMRIYRITEPTQCSRELADVVRLMAIKLEQAIALLHARRPLRDILPYCVEINRLENVADDIFRRAIAELFENEDSAAHIIKWHEIYDQLEGATDSVEDVANVLEGIVLRHA